MIDRDAQPIVKPAVACLQTESKVGTGYLVRGNRIATCHHVVSDLEIGAPVQCAFYSGERRTAYVLDPRDKSSDAALLELREPVSAEPLALDDAIPEDFWIFGYPYFAKVPVSLDATLNDRDTIDQNGIRSFALVSSSFLGETTASIGGLSGSPVLVGRRVIGHLSSVLGSIEAAQRPHLGLVFAVKSTNVRNLLAGKAVAVPIASPAEAHASHEQHLAIAQIQLELQAAATATEVADVLAGKPLDDSTRLFAADRLMGLGQLDDALRLLDRASPSSRRTELQAIAWSLQGAQPRAIRALHEVTQTAETAGILGGVYKRRWLQTSDETWLRASHDAYQVGHEIDAAAGYPAINLAACKLWLGDSTGSRDVATKLAERLARTARSDWDEASLAEALLLAGRVPEARRQYEVAVKTKVGQVRVLAAIRRQVRRELPMLGLASDAFDDLFPVPRIAVFTGHRVDPDEQRGRFPPSRVSDVKSRLARELGDRRIGIGYVSAAAGSDLLFIELLLERGGDPQVFLPFPPADFLATVDAPWRWRVERVLAQLGTRVTILAQAPPANVDDAYFECNEAMQDSALRMGRILDERVTLIGVVAAGSTPKRGNSAEMVSCWRLRGQDDIVLIDPSRVG